jgi:hypothetical protein
VAVLPDGRIVSGSKDSKLRIWSSGSGECEKILEGRNEVSDSHISYLCI